MLTEMESDLQSAETRCKLLEKQLDYMRKLAENAKKERDVLIKSQVFSKAMNQKEVKCIYKY